MSGANEKLNTYHFHVKGEKSIQDVIFQFDGRELRASCTCSKSSEEPFCWHQYYVLSGRTGRLPDTEISFQYKLIQKLSGRPEGRKLIQSARQKFGEKETCRRCNSSDVVELGQSLYGKLLRFFLPKTRQYYCKSCKWSW